MWVRFVAAFTWCPTPASAIAYPAGLVANVTRACAAAALAAGKAEPTKPERRDDDGR
jgi:hypothetical protein